MESVVANRSITIVMSKRQFENAFLPEQNQGEEEEEEESLDEENASFSTVDYPSQSSSDHGDTEDSLRSDDPSDDDSDNEEILTDDEDDDNEEEVDDDEEVDDASESYFVDSGDDEEGEVDDEDDEDEQRQSLREQVREHFEFGTYEQLLAAAYQEGPSDEDIDVENPQPQQMARVLLRMVNASRRHRAIMGWARSKIFRLGRDGGMPYFESGSPMGRLRISPALNVIKLGDSLVPVPEKNPDTGATTSGVLLPNQTEPRFVQFENLPQSTRLAILQFVDLPALVAMRQVNRYYRRLLRSDNIEAWSTIWEPACCNKWPWLRGKEISLNNQMDCARVLFHLAGRETTCSVIDASLFPPDVVETTLSQSEGTSDDDPSIDHEETVIQFLGQVGPGNRCIRANGSLPTASRMAVRSRAVENEGRFGYSRWTPFQIKRKPFVMPYALDETSYSLEPRLVSYYEVEILSPPSPVGEQQRGSNVNRLNNALLARQQVECVAIGIGKEDFAFQTHMPGWTRDSFGYHGDDGGIFDRGPFAHLRTMETFGAGDTVGCGIDYIDRRLFYCKNGQIVHSGDVSESFLSQTWYPCVGLDSRCPVRVNFGEKPFQFDLTSLIRPHQNEVAVTIQRGIACDWTNILGSACRRLDWLNCDLPKFW